MSTPATSGSSSGASSGSSSAGNVAAIAGAVVTTVGGIMIASKSAKETKELMERIGMLSLAQQKELAEKQQAVATEIEKMRILYQYLAIMQNTSAMAALSKHKYIGMAILGTSIIALSIVIIMARKRKQNG